jgi:glyoxylase-like metal-dependent hydrolase (beta-lactamase superfamily II)
VTELRPGVVEDVAPGVRRLVAPNPGLFTGPGTNTYLVGERRLALVDPGPDDDSHLEAIVAAVGDRLRWILVTHTHVDHSPLARRLRKETGAEVLGFGPAPAVTVPGLDAFDTGFRPDRRLVDGDRLDTAERAIDVVHTPGHASGHLCFRLGAEDLLFSGDHVMEGSTVVIAPPDGDMAEYLEALERVRDLRPGRIAPGHGGMIDDPAAVLDHYLAHRRQRERQVADGLAAAGAGGTTAEELVAAIYLEVPAPLHPIAKYSVWAHLRKLANEGRAVTAETADPAARWWVPPHAPGSDRAGL